MPEKAFYDAVKPRIVQSFLAKKSPRKVTRKVARRPDNAGRPSNRRRRSSVAEPQKREVAPIRRAGQKEKIPPRSGGRGKGIALAMGRWIARLSIVGGLAYGLLVGAREGYEYATTSPRFEVRGLLYEPSEHVSDEELRRLMAVSPGTNILSLDLDALAERVVAHPWVAKASVHRVLPDSLEIRVTEHEATAVLLAGSFYLVDGRGRPFKVLEEGERGDLPIITGVSRLEPLGAPGRTRAKLERAVEILAEYGRKRRPRLSEINIDDSGSATLYTAELGTQLRLGRRDVVAALGRYDALRAALGEESDKLAVAHLDSIPAPDQPDRVVASFFAAEEAPGFVADAQTRAQAKVAEAEAAEEQQQARRAKPELGGRKKRSRLPTYE